MKELDNTAEPGDREGSGGDRRAGAGRLPLRERRWFRWATDLLIVAAVYMAVRAYQQRDVARGMAPELSGAALSGASVSLADYRGEPLLVHFWATWCGVCKLQRANVVALAEDMPVVTVASRSGDGAQVAGYAAHSPMGAPILLDPDGALAQRFGVRAYPTSFVLDGEGEIRHVEVGYTSELGLRLRMWLARL